jgi:hypothetical protein
VCWLQDLVFASVAADCRLNLWRLEGSPERPTWRLLQSAVVDISDPQGLTVTPGALPGQHMLAVVGAGLQLFTVNMYNL